MSRLRSWLGLMLFLALLLPFAGIVPAVAQGPATPGSTPMLATAAGAGTPEADSAGITVEEVATVTLLGAAMPEAPAVFDLWTLTLQPRAERSYPSFAPSVSTAADLPLAGAYAVTSEGHMQVQRGGIVEEVALGAEVAIGPGDVAIYVENALAQTVRNPGDSAARLLGFGVYSSEFGGVIDEQDWEQSGLHGRDLAVTVERLTLPPGAGLPPFQPEITAPRLFVVEEGTIEWSIVSADAATPQPTLRLGQGQEVSFIPLDDGKALSLRNPTDQPVTLLQLTLAPA